MRRILGLSLGLSLGLLALRPAPLVALDKSGVAPRAISLPSGPGSVEGLGDSFQPMLNSGSARYAVKIVVPPGVNGNAPELSLRYESGFGDGPAGIGWTFGPGSISRRVDHGLPRYVDGPNGVDDDHDGFLDEADEADTFQGPDGEELVAMGDGTWRPRIEGKFARYRRVGGGWLADLPNGGQLEFGPTPETRVADPSGGGVFRWLLERSTDVNGNVVLYRYLTLSGSDSQRYLAEIRYGPGAPPWSAFRFVVLSYEPRTDRRDDYRGGFLLRTAHRLHQAATGVQGVPAEGCAPGDWNGDGEGDLLTGRYLLTYDPVLPDRSFLAAVTRFGADGVNYLPPVRFGYAVFDPPARVSAAGMVTGAENAPPLVMDSELADFVDLNRDGLADLLRTRVGGGHTAHLNLGEAAAGDGQVIRWADGRDIPADDGQATLLPLSEARVHLADMDGDGLADLVHHTPAGEVRFFHNRGDVGWGPRQTMGRGGTTPPVPFDSPDVTTADLDFDKRMDVVRSTEAGYSVWFNLADGRYSREVRTAGARHRERVIRFSEPGTKVADLNGDRVPDVVRIRPTHLVWAAGRGHGRFAPAVEIPIPGLVLTDGEGGDVSRAALTDVNADGLADLVLERAAANRLYCWLNRGNGSLSGRITVEGMPTIYNPDTAVRWADLNGNGTADLVYADSGATPRLRTLDIGVLLGGTAHPNLLTTIANGLGVTTTIGYRSSTACYLADGEAGNPWTSTVPFPVQVVAAVEVDTGLDLDGVPGPDVHRREYAYRDGFYDDRERAFRGFGQVTVTEPGDGTAPTRVALHGFFTGGPDGLDDDGDGLTDEVDDRGHREEDALKGMLRRREIRSAAGAVFWRDETTWRVRNLLVNPDEIEVRLAEATARERHWVEGTSSPQTVRTDLTYDDFGNVIREERLGSLAMDGDETVSETEFVNDTTRWLLGLPSRRVTRDGEGNRVAETHLFYDGPAFLGLGPGTAVRGNLSRTRDWVEGDTWVSLLRQSHDVYGNVVGTMNPNGHLRLVEYDPEFATWPVREEIQVGGGNPPLVTTALYHAGLGTLTSSTDYNGKVSSFAYDTFGRLTAIVRPADTPARPTDTFRYRLADPRGGLTYDYDAAGVLTLTAGPVLASAVTTRAREVSGADGTFDLVRYRDGLGRPLATVGEAEEGFVVRDAVRFDALGGVRDVFAPYAASSVDYLPPDPSLPSARATYDAAGREVRRDNPPDGDGAVSWRTTVWLPLGREVTDENGHRTTFLQDGQGRPIQVRRENGPETYLTSRTFDPLGRETSLTDPLGNVRTVRHDGLGRRVQVDDPDRGRLLLRYDPAGNVIQRTDNRGFDLFYDYDGADRVLAEHRGSYGTPAVRFWYDLPTPDYPAAGNTAGRLSRTDHPSGAAFFAYDDRGNLTWRIARFQEGTSSLDYRLTREYDSLGRITAGTYPDGDRVEYRYGNGGLLESISGLVADIDYHPSGAMESISFANGVVTSYAFDPRDRITGLATLPGAGSPLQDLAYTFDGVGNLTRVDDLRPGAAGTPAFAGQEFQYDGLDRLTRAQGGGYGRIDYRYDAAGNLTRAGSPPLPDPLHVDDALVNLGDLSYGGAGGTGGRGGRLPGDPPGPHAVTATQSGLYFAYDDNGNQVQRGADTLWYDAGDRLTRVERGGARIDYGYDHQPGLFTSFPVIGLREDVCGRRSRRYPQAKRNGDLHLRSDVVLGKIRNTFGGRRAQLPPERVVYNR